MTASLLKSFLDSVKRVSIISSSNRIGTRRANFHTTERNWLAKCCKDPGYITRLALPPDYDNVIDFMSEAYYKHEPSLVNIGLGGTEAPPLWQETQFEFLEQGISIIAVNKDHCIVGAAINTIVYPSEPQTMYNLARCCNDHLFQKVLEFYAYVSEKADLWNRYCVSRVFEQSCLAVSSDFQREGVAKRLVEESWLLARDCGYRLFSIECNSVYCAKISENFGWEVAWSIPFNQYVRNGEIVFQHIQEPHTICRVFVHNLCHYSSYTLPYKSNKKSKK